jgi:hypothetical protein
MWGGSGLAAAQVIQLPHQENQMWFDGSYTIALGRKTELTGSGGARLGRGLDHWVYERAGASAAFHVLPMLTVAPSFNYIASQPIAGRDAREQRYAVDGILTWHLGKFEMNDRNRFERRVQPKIAYFRYMNRLQIQHPVEIKSQHFNLWIADEIFYYGLLNAWSRNRFSTGISKRLSHGIAVDLYYLRQNDHYASPGDLNAFGMTFKASRK